MRKISIWELPFILPDKLDVFDLLLLLFWWYWSLNSGSHACVTPPLELLPQPFLLQLFFRWGPIFFPKPDMTEILYPCFLDTWDYRYVSTHQLICWDGVSLIYCSGWLRTTVLLISPFQVAGIIEVSHHTQSSNWLYLNCAYLLSLHII
jgi:hypothetical protein